MKGRKVKTLKRLAWLAQNKKAVVVIYCGQYSHRTPAAFIYNWQGKRIWDLIISGWIYEYKK